MFSNQGISCFPMFRVTLTPDFRIDWERGRGGRAEWGGEKKMLISPFFKY